MSNDWWSRRLSENSPAPQTQRPSAPTSPLPNVRYVPEGNVTSTPVTYDPNQDQLVSKAQSSRQNDNCPGCYSGNYFAPNGTSLKRCYDCGYPLQQAGTGAGMPGGSAGGPSTPSKQTTTGNNFNPSVIVDRIG